jgi:hypothetical protein
VEVVVGRGNKHAVDRFFVFTDHLPKIFEQGGILGKLSAIPIDLPLSTSAKGNLLTSSNLLARCLMCTLPRPPMPIRAVFSFGLSLALKLNRERK